jgi:inositol transport system substrate-binding protein
MELKKILNSFMATVLLISLLAACGSEETAGGEDGSKDQLKIGAAMPVFDDKWLSYLYDGITEYDEANDNVEVIMVDAKNDAGKQFSQVETFIVQQVDAILINPVESDSLGPMVDAANEAGIPVVVVNRMPNEDVMQNIYAYVGSESLEAGTIQMEKVIELLGGKGNVAIMNGTLGQESVVKRTQGNKDVLENNPEITLVREQTADYQRSQGMTVMENWIQAGDQIDAVVANNDEMAIGAIMALEAAGQLEGKVIAGIDGTLDALQYVKDGKLNITAFQDAYGQGKGAIEAAVKAVNGEKLDNNFINIPFELVTEENVDEYIAKWEK